MAISEEPQTNRQRVGESLPFGKRLQGWMTSEPVFVRKPGATAAEVSTAWQEFRSIHEERGIGCDASLRRLTGSTTSLALALHRPQRMARHEARDLRALLYAGITAFAEMKPAIHARISRFRGRLRQ